MKKLLSISACFLLWQATCLGQGTILWDEAVNGQFSGNSSSPTVIPAFQTGTNSLLGVALIEPTGNNWFVHEDFLTIHVPDGYFVSSAWL